MKAERPSMWLYLEATILGTVMVVALVSMIASMI